MYKNVDVKGFKDLEVSQIYVMSRLLNSVDIINSILEYSSIKTCNMTNKNKCIVKHVHIFSGDLVDSNDIVLLCIVLESKVDYKQYNMVIVYDKNGFTVNVDKYLKLIKCTNIVGENETSVIILLDNTTDKTLISSIRKELELNLTDEMPSTCTVFDSYTEMRLGGNSVINNLFRVFRVLYNKQPLSTLKRLNLAINQYDIMRGLYLYEEMYDINVDDYLDDVFIMSDVTVYDTKRNFNFKDIQYKLCCTDKTEVNADVGYMSNKDKALVDIVKVCINIADNSGIVIKNILEFIKQKK